MDIALWVLKLIMFTVLIVGPAVIGRHLWQAAKGQAMQPAAAPVAADEAKADE